MLSNELFEYLEVRFLRYESKHQDLLLASIKSHIIIKKGQKNSQQEMLANGK